MKTNMFREHQFMVFSIIDHIRTNPLESATNFSNYCRPLISNYIKQFDTIPDFLQQMRINIDDPNATNQIKNLQANH